MPYPWLPPRGKPDKKAVFSPHCEDKTTTNYNKAKWKPAQTNVSGGFLGLDWDNGKRFPCQIMERGCPAWLKGAPDARPPPQAEPCGAGG